MRHVFERRYETITYPDGDGWSEGWGGFAARVLVNPSGAELRHESNLFVEYRKGGAAAEDEYWQYVASRIPEWNLTIRVDGADREVPPPAENWESIYEVEPAVIAWLALVIHTAHQGPKVRARMQGEIPIASPTDVGTTDSTPPTNLSHLNSQQPAATSSTG